MAFHLYACCIFERRLYVFVLSTLQLRTMIINNDNNAQRRHCETWEYRLQGVGGLQYSDAWIHANNFYTGRFFPFIPLQSVVLSTACEQFHLMLCLLPKTVIIIIVVSHTFDRSFAFKPVDMMVDV